MTQGTIVSGDDVTLFEGTVVPSYLAYFAALRGGEGAYERLQPTLGGDFRDRVGAAAQADPDAVVLAWIEETLGGGVDRSDGSRRRRSAALLWYVLLAIPAARSSRWRLD